MFIAAQARARTEATRRVIKRYLLLIMVRPC